MNNNTIKFLSTKKDVGSRLDILLAKKITNLTRSNLKKIIELRKVRINNSIVSAPSKKIRLNESIIVNLEQKLLQTLFLLMYLFILTEYPK